jgi:flavin-binding protein dodecin
MPAPPRQVCRGAPAAVSWPAPHFRGPEVTAMSSHVYKHLELTGSSPDGVEAAIRNAIAKANETVRNIQWFEVVETRGHVKDGAVAHWQVTLKLGFTLE